MDRFSWIFRQCKIVATTLHQYAPGRPECRPLDMNRLKYDDTLTISTSSTGNDLLEETVATYIAYGTVIVNRSHSGIPLPAFVCRDLQNSSDVR